MRGYTIIEIIITASIFAILSVIALIAFNNAMRGIQIGTATDKLSSDLRYAQTMASGVGVWYGISFETNPVNKYYIYTTTGTVDTMADNPGKRGTSFVVNLGTDFGIIIAAVTIEGGKKVEFNPLETPYTDKLGYATTTEGVITLRRGSSNRTVRITPATGRIYTQ